MRAARQSQRPRPVAANARSGSVTETPSRASRPDRLAHAEALGSMPLGDTIDFDDANHGFIGRLDQEQLFDAIAIRVNGPNLGRAHRRRDHAHRHR